MVLYYIGLVVKLSKQFKGNESSFRCRSVGAVSMVDWSSDVLVLFLLKVSTFLKVSSAFVSIFSYTDDVLYSCVLE